MSLDTCSFTKSDWLYSSQPLKKKKKPQVLAQAYAYKKWPGSLTEPHALRDNLLKPPVCI